MLISREWLQDYIDIAEISNQQLAETLTSLGLEVETCDEIPAIDDLTVVALVEEAQQHGKRLRRCLVNDGQEQHEVICGASNVESGMYVALAKIGATVQGRKITATPIRGVISHGMICSEQELNLGDEGEGIIDLKSIDVPLGTRVNSLFKTEDSVFDIAITPNRGDCLSYLGIARELSAKLGKPVVYPDKEKDLTETDDTIDIVVDELSGCRRFCSLQAQINGTISSSPFWLRRRLRVSGIRPINVVVDITNYVMLEYGQPLHAYDATDINGALLKVERANGKQQTFVSLDGQERQLQEGDILICDKKRVIGLAGIIGGANSEIKTTTRQLVIELANFDALAINKTARRLALQTESSYRFARGVDVEHLFDVGLRTRALFAALLPAGSTISRQPRDIYPLKHTSTKIAVRLTRARKILGLPGLTQNTCQQTLESLACRVVDQTSERLLVEVPSYRYDLSREIDLIEELGRLRGFDTITSELPFSQLSAGLEGRDRGFSERLASSLAGQGLQETCSFAMVARDDYQRLTITSGHPLYPTVELRNPINTQLQVMQTTLLPNLLQALVNNRNHRRYGVKLFEIARGYFADDLQVTDKFAPFSYMQQQGRHVPNDQLTRPREHNIVAGIIDSPVRLKDWQGDQQLADIYWGKRLLLNVCAELAISPTVENIDSDCHPFLNPYASLYLIANNYLGYLGELHPRVLRNFKIDSKVLFFELLVDRLAEARQQTKVVSIAKYPPICRDLAFVMAKELPYRRVLETVANFSQRNYLKEFRLFDIFELTSDKKSLAFNASFVAADRTLTDEEVEEEINALIEWFAKCLGAELRS